MVNPHQKAGPDKGRTVCVTALLTATALILGLAGNGCTQTSDEYAAFRRLFTLAGATPPGVVLRLNSRLVVHQRLVDTLNAALSTEERQKILVVTDEGIRRLSALIPRQALREAASGPDNLGYELDVPEEVARFEVVGLAKGKHIFFWNRANVEPIRAMLELVSLDHEKLHALREEVPGMLREYLVEHYAPVGFRAGDDVTVGLFQDVCLACPSGVRWQALDGGPTSGSRTILFVPKGLVGIPAIDLRGPGSVVARYAPDDKTLTRLMIQASLLGTRFPAVWEPTVPDG